MYNIYLFLKTFTDPLFFSLVLAGIGLLAFKNVKKEQCKKIWWFLLLLLSFLYCLSIPLVASSLAYLMEKDLKPPEPSQLQKIQVLVVLGGGVLKADMKKKVEPSGETASRLLFGLHMLMQTDAQFIIMSGGGNKITEAQVMARAARRLGVDESIIIAESRSRNTREHALELKKILKDENITVGIVTSALHMKRSLTAFGRHFRNVIPLPSSYLYSPSRLSVKSFLPSSRRLYISSSIIHEILGLAWYNLRG